MSSECIYKEIIYFGFCIGLSYTECNKHKPKNTQISVYVIIESEVLGTVWKNNLQSQWKNITSISSINL